MMNEEKQKATEALLNRIAFNPKQKENKK